MSNVQFSNLKEQFKNKLDFIKSHINFTYVLFLLAIVVIIVIIMLIGTSKESFYGYWEATLKFCSSAGIKSASLIFGDRLSIQINDKEQTVDYHIRRGICGNYKLILDDDVLQLPSQYDMTFDKTKGTMTLMSDDILYFDLIKNNRLSNIIHAF
jgi:hypothetical protein